MIKEYPMPLYLVRWAGLEATIVRANDEEHLVDILDEVADPGACSWIEYDGPLWVDFQIPVEFEIPQNRKTLTVDDIEIKDTARFSVHNVLHPGHDGADTYWEMCNKIVNWAFPAVAKLSQDPDLQDEEEPPVDDVKAALRSDLEQFLQYRWRKASVERRTDAEAEMMKNLRVTRPVPAMLHRPSDDAEGEKDE
ncbi:MAG TPA: hypothetical protein PLF11_07735 [Bacillota bacterium]|nr:hypothetical protein [Bacillota bacterium]